MDKGAHEMAQNEQLEITLYELTDGGEPNGGYVFGSIEGHYARVEMGSSQLREICKTLIHWHPMQSSAFTWVPLPLCAPTVKLQHGHKILWTDLKDVETMRSVT